MKQPISSTIAKAILSSFTDFSGFRDNFSKPFESNTFVCATDAKAIIAISNDYIEGVETAPCPHDFRIDKLLDEAFNAPVEFDNLIFVDDFNKVCSLETTIDIPSVNQVVKIGNVFIRATLFYKVILAAQMLGSSSISFIPATKSDQPFSFRIYDGESIIVAGIIMPMWVGDSNEFKVLPLSYQSPIFPYYSQINLEAGEAYYNQYISEQKQADEEYANSKKVYLVQVVKTAWIPVEAVDPRAAMELAKQHTGGIDDDMFDESDIEVEACNSYPEDDDEVGYLSDQTPTRRQGILTDDGWISWSKYYNEDETEDEFHKTRTTVKVDFGK